MNIRGRGKREVFPYTGDIGLVINRATKMSDFGPNKVSVLGRGPPTPTNVFSGSSPLTPGRETTASRKQH